MMIAADVEDLPARDMARHYREVRRRLFHGASMARPGANLPQTQTTMLGKSTRSVVDFDYAMQLVCDATDMPPDVLATSTYSAATAARHMLWTVLADGGWPVASIAFRFAVDDSTVRGGIAAYRAFERSKARL